MEIKRKVEGACFRALGLSILLITAGAAEGATLWNNGAVQSAGACEGACGNSSGPIFTIFDNFTVAPGKWQVTGFDYTDFFVGSDSTQYTSTLWSIWAGDPLSGGTVIASGNSVASLSTVNCSLGPKSCEVQFTVGGLAVQLTSGTTYYLGTASVETGGATTQRALAAGNGLSGYEQSNGGSPTSPPGVGTTWVQGTSNSTFPTSDTAFDITGFQLPEPGTLSLMGLAIAGLWAGRRRLIAHRKATT